MIISDLNHLESISEGTHVVGSGRLSDYFLASFFEKQGVEQIIFSEATTPDGSGEAFSATGKLSGGGYFAFASASYTSPTL
jgi:hypothetical protein